jgi:hypothetical protein
MPGSAKQNCNNTWRLFEMADADQRGWLRDGGSWIADRPINRIDEFSLGNNRRDSHLEYPER